MRITNICKAVFRKQNVEICVTNNVAKSQSHQIVAAASEVATNKCKCFVQTDEFSTPHEKKHFDELRSKHHIH